MSSDQVPPGLDDNQAMTYLTGAVVENARVLEEAITRLPSGSADPEIQAALDTISGLEERLRRERNLVVHDTPRDLDSVRGTAQVLRRIRIQVDAVESVLTGRGDRRRLLRIASGVFRVDAIGNPVEVPEAGT